MGSCLAAAACLFLTGSSLAAQGGGLEPPVKVEAGGQPIDVEVGHAAPAMADLNGDGRRDLLVGQFGGGKVRVYRNTGTEREPRFEGFEWLKAGEHVAQVPVG